jgi:thiol:disulfide interchange protein DsbC
MLKSNRPVPALVLAAIFSLNMAAAQTPDAKAKITARFPDIRAEQINPSPVAGLYEVRIGSKITYVSADAKYLVQGEIVDLETDQNLTESRREGVRRDVLKGVNEASMVVFAPARWQSTITVFTDIDCGYCRKLHNQIADYNARGIRVRYMYFPRMGPGSEGWKKAEQVACAKDRRSALTRSKRGEVLKDKPCQPNVVAQHFNVGRDFGLQGTPAIVLDSGELIGGYLSPEELSKYMAETKVAKN